MYDLIKILTTFLIAILSSVVTVQLSLKKFRSERLWERKVESYERVIEAFYKSKKFSSKHLSIEYSRRELAQEEEESLKNLANEAVEEISHASDIGSFLLSENAINILSRYNEETEHLKDEPTWVLYLEGDLSLTKKYMKEFIEEAKKDLRR